LGIAGGAEHGHGRLALVAVVDHEIGQGLQRLRRLRVARRGCGEPRHQQQQEEQPHQAFFWYVPWCLTQSQPLSGLVYLLHGSGSTFVFVREMILNWPSLRISPISTGRYVWWLYSCILMVPTGAANVWPYTALRTASTSKLLAFSTATLYAMIGAFSERSPWLANSL